MNDMDRGKVQVRVNTTSTSGLLFEVKIWPGHSTLVLNPQEMVDLVHQGTLALQDGGVIGESKGQESLYGIWFIFCGNDPGVIVDHHVGDFDSMKPKVEQLALKHRAVIWAAALKTIPTGILAWPCDPGGMGPKRAAGPATGPAEGGDHEST